MTHNLLSRRNRKANKSRAWRLIALEDRITPAVTEFLDPNPAPGNVFGSAMVTLNNGNVVITAPGDDAGGTNAGAVYLFNGATGALISTLRGAQPNDSIGGAVYALTNGNFVVASWQWDNGAIAEAGAVTWGNGTTGVSGVVSAANSLIGSTLNDQLGINGVVALTNGNYVVPCEYWDNGALVNAGSVTWGNGATGGPTGPINSANSLVGSKGNDSIGDYVMPLTNGNYVAVSRVWDNGSIQDAGAVTWGNGSTGITGTVSAANSLVGGKLFDFIGGTTVVNSSSSCVNALANGNYVVRSQLWDNGSAIDCGAVTWANGATGITGAVSSLNSLVGKGFDSIGTNLTELTNGNFVVGSYFWNNGSASKAGALTWMNGTTGLTGTISVANSLVGSTSGDNVGTVTALSNGNYVANTVGWNNGSISDVGAATWANGTTGITGTISTANSLIGTKQGDGIGSAFELSNGNYVVCSGAWDNGAVADVGAVTWCNGTTGTTGVVSAANSLIGSNVGDGVGNRGVTALTNGNYVVFSSNWANGAMSKAGAVTWGIGTTGTVGVVSAANSLVGTTADESNGTTVVALKNGNYIVSAPYWANDSLAGVGAVTWGNGTTGISGTRNAANSLIGNKSNDQVGYGGIATFANGHYAVVTPAFNNGAVAYAGALTWGNGNTGISGPVTAANSLLGSAEFSGQKNNVIIDNVNGTFFGRWTNDGTGRVRGGYLATGFATPLPTVTNVTFGDGTNQRSTVRQIVVTLSESVNFTGSVASAFTLSRTGPGGTLGNVTLTANPATGSAGSVILTFSGSLSEFGSLVDGLYNLTINAAQVSSSAGSLDGNNDGVAGGNYVVTGTTANKFFRLFGDSNGDGSVTALDFNAFRLQYGTTGLSIFDFDNDNSVSALDFNAFRLRYGVVI